MEGGASRPPQSGRLAPLALAHDEVNAGVHGQPSSSARPLRDDAARLHAAREAPLKLGPSGTSPARSSHAPRAASCRGWSGRRSARPGGASRSRTAQGVPRSSNCRRCRGFGGGTTIGPRRAQGSSSHSRIPRRPSSCQARCSQPATTRTRIRRHRFGHRTRCSTPSRPWSRSRACSACAWCFGASGSPAHAGRAGTARRGAHRSSCRHDPRPADGSTRSARSEPL